MANSKRKCRYCGEYKPASKMEQVPLGYFCNREHAALHGLNKAKVKRNKEERKKHREAKQRIKSRGEWLKEAQAAFNKYIRLRDLKWFQDKGEQPVCISCQKPPKKMNAGHYRSVGGNPELRFEEVNNNLQCEHCNTHLSGNLIDYRINLINKIGFDKVKWLEGPHDPKKYTIDDIKEIKAKYTKLARELEKQLN